MSRQKKNVSILSGVNQHILNVITPSGIDYTKMAASLGENEGVLYFISAYPKEVDYGWLSDICNLEGTITQVEFKCVESKQMTDAFNNQIKEIEMIKKIAKEESEKQVYEDQIEDLRKMIRRISVLKEPVGYMNIILFIQARTQERLEERITRVNSVLAYNGCNVRLLKYRQIQAMQSIAPYGLPEEVVKRKGNRNIPISTFTGGFPMADSGIDDEDGRYIGKTINNRLIFLNMWLRWKDRVNSNWVITGIPGTGKSTAVKNLFVLEIAFGTRIIVKDPEREYRDLAKHPFINGDIVNCAGGENGRINPLQIRPLPVVKCEDLREDEHIEDYMEYDDSGSAMALHIQWLRTFFKMYFGKENYDKGIEACLEECLEEIYAKKNIYWETDVSKLKPEDFPYMEDLYYKAEEKSKQEDLTEYSRNIFERLKYQLRSAAIGADKNLWNGPTTIKAKSKFVVLDTHNLHEADEKVKNAQNYNISGWAWHEMSKDRNERVMYGEDEGYLSVDPDYPEQMKFLRNVSKRDRKYESAFVFITHSLVDILDPAVKRFGQAIIDNACYKLVMGCDGKNLEETAQLFNLSAKEITYLSTKTRGAGILFAGSTRQAITIDVPKKILDMMGTAGGR